jgi:16S rRNA (guanine(527)-N(7))-methyltransferase RsmG
LNSADELKRLMKECGVFLNSDIADRLLIYLALLEKWNSRINLTSSTEWSAIKPLFQEGIWAAKLYQADAVSHLDIGSGAGFPAMLLRILKPHIQLDMVESRAKRCVFLETLIDSLGIGESKVHCLRLKTFLQNSNKIWDCVTWKGLKLSDDDIKTLLLHSHQLTQFWMFHGREMAVKEPAIIEQCFQLIRSEKFEDRRWWALSIYLPK